MSHTGDEDQFDADGMGGGGSARGVISQARAEVLVDKLSAPYLHKQSRTHLVEQGRI